MHMINSLITKSCSIDKYSNKNIRCMYLLSKFQVHCFAFASVTRKSRKIG